MCSQVESGPFAFSGLVNRSHFGSVAGHTPAAGLFGFPAHSTQHFAFLFRFRAPGFFDANGARRIAVGTSACFGVDTAMGGTGAREAWLVTAVGVSDACGSRLGNSGSWTGCSCRRAGCYACIDFTASFAEFQSSSFWIHCLRTVSRPLDTPPRCDPEV